MSLAVREEKDAAVVAVGCHLDYGFAGTFKERILQLIEAGQRHLVIDLSGVNFVDSSGLGALVSVLRAVSAKGGDVVLAGLQPNIRAMLELTRLDRIFAVYDTPADALAALARKD